MSITSQASCRSSCLETYIEQVEKRVVLAILALEKI